jgi:hypothetical protein
MKFSANEQAKELIIMFYPGSDVIQNELSIKCCDKIIGALESQRIQSLDVNEYWEDVKKILEQK